MTLAAGSVTVASDATYTGSGAALLLFEALDAEQTYPDPSSPPSGFDATAWSSLALSIKRSTRQYLAELSTGLAAPTFMRDDGSGGSSPSGTGLVYVASGTPEAVTIGSGLTLSGSAGSRTIAAAGGGRTRPTPGSGEILAWALSGASPWQSDGATNPGTAGSQVTAVGSSYISGVAGYASDALLCRGNLGACNLQGPTGLTYVPSSSFAIEAWIAPFDVSTDQVICGHATGGSWDALLWIFGGKLSFAAGASFPSGPLAAAVPVSRTPIHVAVSVTGTTASLYVNGAPAGDVTIGASVSFGAGTWWLADSFGGGAALRGLLGDVRVHNTTRAASYWRDRAKGY